MTLFKKHKCPKCGSIDVSRDAKNLLGNVAIKTLGTAVEIAIDVPLMMVKGAIFPKGSSMSYAAGARAKELGKKAHDAIVGNKADYKRFRCNRCGKEWNEWDPKL